MQAQPSYSAGGLSVVTERIATNRMKAEWARPNVCPNENVPRISCKQGPESNGSCRRELERRRDKLGQANGRFDRTARRVKATYRFLEAAKLERRGSAPSLWGAMGNRRRFTRDCNRLLPGRRQAFQFA